MDSKQIDLAAVVFVVIGTLLCLAAGLGRIAGMYYIAGFQAVTLFIGGIAVMVFATYLKLHVLCQRQAG